MQLNIETNLADLERKFSAQVKQVRFAAARTMTRIATEARADVRDKLPTIFDSPTRYTLNSMYIRKASPTRLESEIYFKGSRAGDPKAELHYLISQIKGGARRATRFEGRMRMQGYISKTERLLPTRYADIDANGNMSYGQRTKILSQLKTAVVVGDYSNASNSRRSKAKRAVTEYFWSNGPGERSRTRPGRKDHLMRGVWRVDRTGFGNGVRPVMLVATNSFVRYAKRFDFAGIVQSSMSKKFDRIFEQEFRNALATAR